MSRLDVPLGRQVGGSQLSGLQLSASLIDALKILVLMIYKQGKSTIRQKSKTVEQKMKILLFLCVVTVSRPTEGREKTDRLLNELLEAMDQVYSWKIENYYGEYQDGLAQVNGNAVKIAFTFFDRDTDGRVTKDELLINEIRLVFKCGFLLSMKH